MGLLERRDRSPLGTRRGPSKHPGASVCRVDYAERSADLWAFVRLGRANSWLADGVRFRPDGRRDGRPSRGRTRNIDSINGQGPHQHLQATSAGHGESPFRESLRDNPLQISAHDPGPMAVVTKMIDREVVVSRESQVDQHHGDAQARQFPEIGDPVRQLVVVADGQIERWAGVPVQTFVGRPNLLGDVVMVLP